MNNNSHKENEENISQEFMEKWMKHKRGLELGWFGRCFGGKDIAPINISGIVLIILVLTGVILTAFVILCCKEYNIGDLWQFLTPLITLILGYMFGNKNASNQQQTNSDKSTTI